MVDTSTQWEYNGVMKLVKRNFWINLTDMKRLAALAKRKQLKTAQLVRWAISEYLERNEEKS